MYGIKNCDTVKKARKFLDNNFVTYIFHDFKKDGVDKVLLTSWIEELGWEALVNKRGTTWHKFSEPAKESVTDKHSALKIMLENPSVIKRPVLDLGGRRIVGFNGYEELSK